MSTNEKAPAAHCLRNGGLAPQPLHARRDVPKITARGRQRAWSRALDQLLGVDDYPDVDALYPRVTFREVA